MLNHIATYSTNFWWPIGLNNSALVWLTWSAVVMYVGPAVVSMVYVLIADRRGPHMLAPVVPTRSDQGNSQEIPRKAA
jgi:hypothetical protein